MYPPFTVLWFGSVSTCLTSTRCTSSVPKWYAMIRVHEYKKNNTWCNAMWLIEKIWLDNYLPSKHNKRAHKANGLGLQYKNLFNYFSLKCFLQKVLLNLLRTTKQIHRARRVTRDFYSTKKHIRPSGMKVTHNMILGINFNYARSIWIIEIKPAEKDCLATSITGKLWLATNQKQKHDLQL